MSNRDNARERLRSVLMSDKAVIPQEFSDLLKSRLTEVLSDYFELLPGTLELDLDTDRGEYVLEVRAFADRIKDVGRFARRR